MTQHESDESMGTLGQLRDLFASIFKRNYGPFLASMLMVSLTLGALIAAAKTERIENREAASSLEALFKQKQVPPRSESPLAVSVAALSLLKRMIVDQPEDSMLLDITGKAFASRVEGAIRRQLAGLGRSEAAPVKLVRCAAGRHAFRLDDPRSFVFVPEQFAMMHPLGGDGADATTNGIAQREAARAKEVEPQLAAIASSLKSDYYVVVTAYYVSAHGALANWSNDLRPPCDLLAGDDGYSLAERPYMIELRKALRQGATVPARTLDFYVDEGGRGIVETTCVADVRDGDVYMSGAVCVDYQPKLFASLTDKAPRAKLGILEGKLERASSKSGSLSDRTNIWCETSPSGPHDTAGTPPVCHVPVSTDQGLWLRIAYRSPELRPVIVLCCLTLITAIVLLLAVRFTASWRDAERRLALLRDLPAGVIQVQQSQSTEDGANETISTIVAANDVAEELLEAELPSFMASTGRRARDAQNFWTLFEPTGCEVELDVHDGSGEAAHAPREKRKRIELQSRILAKRRLGLASAYWVKLRSGKRRWLQVQGTPEFTAGPPRGMSFSLLTKLPTEDVRTIESEKDERLV